MSARNWTTCPRCKQRQLVKIDKIKQQYGVLSRNEYEISLIREKQELDDICSSEFVREDYELGIDNTGKFFISYGASCEKCDFIVSFTHNVG